MSHVPVIPDRLSAGHGVAGDHAHSERAERSDPLGDAGGDGRGDGLVIGVLILPYGDRS